MSCFLLQDVAPRPPGSWELTWGCASCCHASSCLPGPVAGSILPTDTPGSTTLTWRWLWLRKAWENTSAHARYTGKTDRKLEEEEKWSSLNKEEIKMQVMQFSWQLVSSMKTCDQKTDANKQSLDTYYSISLKGVELPTDFHTLYEKVTHARFLSRPSVSVWLPNHILSCSPDKTNCSCLIWGHLDSPFSVPVQKQCTWLFLSLMLAIIFTQLTSTTTHPYYCNI